jgi:hypothetical protein
MLSTCRCSNFCMYKNICWRYRGGWYPQPHVGLHTHPVVRCRDKFSSTPFPVRVIPHGLCGIRHIATPFPLNVKGSVHASSRSSISSPVYRTLMLRQLFDPMIVMVRLLGSLRFPLFVLLVCAFATILLGLMITDK